MQLDKIVSYHKALADPNRLRMLVLLADGERNGLELAEKLGVTPATVTHHAAKLREASLINERREKNTIYFSLNDYFLKNSATAASEFIYRGASARGETNPMDAELTRLKESVIRNFSDKEGKLKQIPSQLKKKLIVLEHIVSGLEKSRTYTEKEINEFIKQYNDDFATIRREFIMHQFMFRDKETYELNPPELWARWESLS
ncbi:metalloregulator ArsR/SmtB family transcription factor (plasmid) [Paenibacillus cellulosilyticus]|nr:metalloregulator ArsR/SmtB family transcription factor [Paenibacillus cellulosilyticus]QKS47062.1 metalloregulator ArsR/SmtB family transcription factor [Paenibacillus cellulosilyticus]